MIADYSTLWSSLSMLRMKYRELFKTRMQKAIGTFSRIFSFTRWDKLIWIHTCFHFSSPYLFVFKLLFFFCLCLCHGTFIQQFEVLFSSILECFPLTFQIWTFQNKIPMDALHRLVFFLSLPQWRWAPQIDRFFFSTREAHNIYLLSIYRCFLRDCNDAKQNSSVC